MGPRMNFVGSGESIESALMKLEHENLDFGQIMVALLL